MCGIGGIRRFGDTPITQDQVTALLLALESRGNDATGVAVQAADGAISVHKAPTPAWTFTAEKVFDTFCEQKLPDAICVLVHTRYATQGDPKENNNNHPMFSGRCAVVHNGCISNDDVLFKSMKLERKAETDSDIIRAIVDDTGLTRKAFRELDRMSGSCAAAIVSQDEPGKLMLLRSGSPLVLASSQDQLFWASTKEALHSASRLWQQRFGIWMKANVADLMFKTVGADTGMLFDDEGLTWHEQFRSCIHYVAPTYAGLYDVSRRRARKGRFCGTSGTDSGVDGGGQRGVVATHVVITPAVKTDAKLLESVSGTQEKPRLKKCPWADCKAYYDTRTVGSEPWRFKCGECGRLLGGMTD
jgi:predicted glutamine amidotransferase